MARRASGFVAGVADGDNTAHQLREYLFVFRDIDMKRVGGIVCTHSASAPAQPSLNFTLWRFLKFLGFGDNRDEDKAVEPNAKTPPKEPEERKQQFATWYIFAAFLGVLLIQYLWASFAQIETIPYSQFEQLLAENKISEVLVGTETIQGTLKEPL